MPKAARAALPSAGAMIRLPPPCLLTSKERASRAPSLQPLYRWPQGGGDPAVLGEQHIVGAAGRAGIHRLKRDAAGLEPGAQIGGDRDHAAAKPEQEKLDATMFNDRSEAFGCQRRRRPRQCPVGKDQHRALVDYAADAK